MRAAVVVGTLPLRVGGKDVRKDRFEIEPGALIGRSVQRISADPVVGEDRVLSIVRLGPPHVARHAIVGGVRTRPLLTGSSAGLAIVTDHAVVAKRSFGILIDRNMRVVTRQALHLAVAFQVAATLDHAIRLRDETEARNGLLLVAKRNKQVGDRHPRPEVSQRAIVAHHAHRGARVAQVTLETNLQALFGRQSGRVDDRRIGLSRIDPGVLRVGSKCYMRFARPMATLATDPHGQRFVVQVALAFHEFDAPVVAKNATRGDLSTKVIVLKLETGAKHPELFGRIPTDGSLE